MLGGAAQRAGKCLIDLAIRQTQRILCILPLLRDRRLRGQLAGHAQRRLIHQPTGGRQGGGCIELQGWIAAGGQMLADEQRDEDQRQDAEQAKAAKVTKLGNGGECGRDGSYLVRDRRPKRLSIRDGGLDWSFWIVMKQTGTGAQSSPLPH